MACTTKWLRGLVPQSCSTTVADSVKVSEFETDDEERVVVDDDDVVVEVVAMTKVSGSSVVVVDPKYTTSFVVDVSVEVRDVTVDVVGDAASHTSHISGQLSWVTAPSRVWLQYETSSKGHISGLSTQGLVVVSILVFVVVEVDVPDDDSDVIFDDDDDDVEDEVCVVVKVRVDDVVGASVVVVVVESATVVISNVVKGPTVVGGSVVG